MSKRTVTGVAMGVLAFVLVSATIVADVAVADARIALPFSDQFVGVNPCTGLSQTGTVTGTLYLQENQGATVVTVDRNITTTAGYEGSGRSTLVVNSEIQKFSLQDMITNESGSRIRLDFILVIDLASGTVTTVHGALACVSQ